MKLKENQKKRLHLAFRRFLTWKSNGHEIKQYLGVDIGEVREWIEEMFLDGMNWDNYGTVWQVDHIVPLRMFDLFDEGQLKIAWHYKNLMPLYKADNLNKEGNVHFSYQILLSLKDKDIFYSILFNMVKKEYDSMNKYIDKYNYKWIKNKTQDYA